MDNSDLLRGLSSTAVQVFGIALIVLILALNAESAAIGKPVALIAGLVLLAISAHWVAQGTWRSHPDRRRHGHR